MEDSCTFVKNSETKFQFHLLELSNSEYTPINKEGKTNACPRYKQKVEDAHREVHQGETEILRIVVME